MILVLAPAADRLARVTELRLADSADGFESRYLSYLALDWLY